jgi:uncharacterized membrane protein (DUF373 family)
MFYNRIKLFYTNTVSIEVSIAIILFLISLTLFTPIEIIIKLLYFIVILEITRMVVEYIRSDNHRVKIRYLVDAVIIAIIREILIIIVDSHNLSNNFSNLITYILLEFTFIILRIIVMKATPDDLESCYKKDINE